MKELTEAMQRLCAVANRIVAQNGHASRIEIDLLLEDLRGLYDIALQLTGDALPDAPAARQAEPDEAPVKDEAQMMAMMSTMAAMTTAEVEEPEREARPEENGVQEAEAQEREDEVREEQSGQQEAEGETHEAEAERQEEEVEAPVQPAAPEPMPRMEELEQNGNELLFDEIIIEPKEEEPKAPAMEQRAESDGQHAESAAPKEDRAAAHATQASLLDYLSQQPATRTLGETLGADRPQPSSLERKVDDLRTVININDKFSFMSELFRNNMKAYNDFILHLNALQSRDEALAYVREVSAQYKWDETSVAVQSFYKIFDKKF